MAGEAGHGGEHEEQLHELAFTMYELVCHEYLLHLQKQLPGFFSLVPAPASGQGGCNGD